MQRKDIYLILLLSALAGITIGISGFFVASGSGVISVSGPGRCSGIAVAGNNILAAYDNFPPSNYCGLVLYDVSDPRAPAVLSTINISLQSVHDQYIVVANNCAYVNFKNYSSLGMGYYGINQTGFYVINISNPRDMQLVQTVVTNLSVQGMATYQTYLYLASGSHGLHVFDISMPSNPKSVVNLTTPDDAEDIVISGQCAYVACKSGGIVYDLTNPVNPNLIANLPSSEFGWKIDASGTIGGLAKSATYEEYPKQFVLFDITQPERSNVLATLNFTNEITDIIITDTIAYVSCYGDGVAVVEISNPVSPRIINYRPNFDINVLDSIQITLLGRYLYNCEFGLGDLVIFEVPFVLVATNFLFATIGILTGVGLIGIFWFYRSLTPDAARGIGGWVILGIGLILSLVATQLLRVDLRILVDPIILVGTFIYGIALCVTGIWAIKTKYNILRQMKPQKQPQSPQSAKRPIPKVDVWDMQPNIIQFLCGVMNVVIPIMVLIAGSTLQPSSYVGSLGIQFTGGIGFFATFFRSWTARARNYNPSQELEKKETVEVQPRETPLK